LKIKLNFDWIKHVILKINLLYNSDNNNDIGYENNNNNKTNKTIIIIIGKLLAIAIIIIIWAFGCYFYLLVVTCWCQLYLFSWKF